MIKSMTGYGKGVCELSDKVITVEIKSLNSKQIDIYTRIPGIYREKDLDIRNLISQRLSRGKVEVNMVVEITDARNASKLNKAIIKEYYKQLKEIGADLGIDYNESILQVIMRLPETLQMDKEEIDSSEWKKIAEALNSAIDSVESFRTQEGEALKKDILSKVNHIEELMESITPFEQERIESIRQKIQNSLSEHIEQDKIDDNRFEQELIYYLEKFDINEEKVRLKNHCKFFREVCESIDSSGKKLGFISQEMGREINTIGSKANHSEIQRLVVGMKDELEKIKEQTLNIL
ncbi:MAG: YicC family protein [Bacteroidales bacterium]|nr:YicC family protein [Bacteroidales bacterium]MBN2819621.1 YicC family protein [Bacteroidales bacterium]